MLALLTAARIKAGRGYYGFINPLLYYAGNRNATATEHLNEEGERIEVIDNSHGYEYNDDVFFDVTTGSTRCMEDECCTYGWQAYRGFDIASGLGSFDFQGFARFDNVVIPATSDGDAAAGAGGGGAGGGADDDSDARKTAEYAKVDKEWESHRQTLYRCSPGVGPGPAIPPPFVVTKTKKSMLTYLFIFCLVLLCILIVAYLALWLLRKRYTKYQRSIRNLRGDLDENMVDDDDEAAVAGGGSSSNVATAEEEEIATAIALSQVDSNGGGGGDDGVPQTSSGNLSNSPHSNRNARGQGYSAGDGGTVVRMSEKEQKTAKSSGDGGGGSIEMK
jgi:hypothetical protein